MANANTQEVAREQWLQFLADFTRENRGSHARVEVLGAEMGDQIPVEDRPFDGIAADVKDGEDTVWISFGSGAADHLTHGVRDVQAIRVLQSAGDAGPTLEVESRDGSKTLVELSNALSHALPPGSGRG